MAAGMALTACNPLEPQPLGNVSVPQPAKPVELGRYLSKWYEQGRYEASFQKGCEGVTADYAAKPDGSVSVINSCRQGSLNGPLKTAEASVRVVDGSNSSKLKVTFFWPVEGDYWVLDHADDYSWSIVGEPSGKFLWILTRAQKIGARQYEALTNRAARWATTSRCFDVRSSNRFRSRYRHIIRSGPARAKPLRGLFIAASENFGCASADRCIRGSRCASWCDYHSRAYGNTVVQVHDVLI